MLRFAKWLPCLAAIAGAVMLGTASPARAGIEIQLSLTEGTNSASAIYDETTNSWVSQSLTGSTTGSFSYSSGKITFNGTVGDFSTLFSYASSNSPGTTYLADANNGNDFVTNNATSNQSLTVEVSATGFTSPNSPPPLPVKDTITASMISGTGSATAQGYADATDALGGTGFASSPLSISSIPQTTSASDNGGTYGFSPNGAAYSLTFTSTFALSGNGQLNVLGGGVSTAVPEPASMMAALSAVPFLALGAWMRCRKQVAIA